MRLIILISLLIPFTVLAHKPVISFNALETSLDLEACKNIATKKLITMGVHKFDILDFEETITSSFNNVSIIVSCKTDKNIVILFTSGEEVASSKIFKEIENVYIEKHNKSVK